jgi:hypothetical protein
MSWDDSTYNWAEMQQEATIVLEGEFPVMVVASDAVKSANGKDMIKAKFKIESGTYAGRALFTNFVISPESPGAMRMFFTQLAVFGLDAAFFASIAGQPPTAIAQALDGRKAIAIVGKGVWQGTEREEIKGYKPALGGHGGGAFVAGLGTSIGSSVGSSPLGSPSPSSFNSSPLAGAQGAALNATVQTTEAVPDSVGAEPTTAPPPVPAF